MAEKINDGLLLYGLLGLGVGLLIASRQHEQERDHWHRIHMYKRHKVAEGLKLLHHGLYDLEHNDREEGLSLIEQGAEDIQRAVGLGFPNHTLFHPHPRHHHIKTVGHIIQDHGSYPINHVIHSHTPIQHQAAVARFDNSQKTILGIV